MPSIRSAPLSASSPCLALLALAACATAPSAALPHCARRIPMPRVTAAPDMRGSFPRLDHLGYDPATERLFLGSVNCDSMEVIDLRDGRAIASITGVSHPQGIAVVPSETGAARVFLGCGGDGKAHVYDAGSLQEIGAVFAGDDADNVRWDPRTGHVFVGCGTEEGGVITELDPHSLAVVGRTMLPAHAESFRLDPASDRMFVNVPGAKRATEDGAVLVADRRRGVVEATWPLHDGARNFPLAWVPEQNVVLTICRRPSVLIALDADSGEEVGRTPCTADSDDFFYDAETGRVLVIGGGRWPDASAPDAGTPPATGGLQVFAMPERGVFRDLGTLPLPPHARTGLFVPERRAIYVDAPAQADGTPAEILEFVLD